MKHLDGRGAITAIALGISLGLSAGAVYRTLPPLVVVAQPAKATVPVVVARFDLPAEHVLAGTDLEVRQVPPDTAIDSALKDLGSREHIRLLAPVGAGQQVLAFRRE